MRKTSSAPCLRTLKQKHLGIKPIINEKRALTLVKGTYDPKVKKAYIVTAVLSSIAFGYYNIAHVEMMKMIGNTTFTLCCGYSLAMSFAKDYSETLDNWRIEEACYEEKTDLPEWDWKIINMF